MFEKRLRSEDSALSGYFWVGVTLSVASTALYRRSKADSQFLGLLAAGGHVTVTQVGDLMKWEKGVYRKVASDVAASEKIEKETARNSSATGRP